jgi:hypothetical protein
VISLKDYHDDRKRGLFPRIYTKDAFDTEGIELDYGLECKLDFIADVKNFAIEQLGMGPSPNYMRYRELKDARTLYWLFVTPKTDLPLDRKNSMHLLDIGEEDDLPSEGTLIKSSIDDLAEEAEFYKKKGYDVLRREIRDFNDGLGCDLTSKFFRRRLTHQVSTVLHEDWHYMFNNCWHREYGSPRDIDEPAAQVVGYAGAAEFMWHVYGEGSDPHKDSCYYYHALRKEANALNRAYDNLNDILDSDCSDRMKMLRRRLVFMRLRWDGYDHNNASLWEIRPYKKHLPVFLDAYEKAGNVKAFIDLMRDCPIDTDDALDYIGEYLKTPS